MICQQPILTQNPLTFMLLYHENQQQTQPTYDTGTGSRTRATLVGGECSHHCAIPAIPAIPLTTAPSLLPQNISQIPIEFFL